VVKAYAKMLAGAGGEIRKSDIKSIIPDGEGWRVVLDDGALSARHVVVALGPGRRIFCGRSAIAFPGVRARLPPRIQNRTRHVHCSVDP